MAKNILTLGDRYCRTCLQEFESMEHNTESMIKHCISSEIASKLASCTTANVDLNDEYPRNLCDCCFNKLNKFDAFRIMCASSLQRFREMLELAAVSEEEFEYEQKVTLAEQITTEVERTDKLSSNLFLVTEVDEIAEQESKEMKNPLDIDKKRQRNRKKLKSTKRTAISKTCNANLKKPKQEQSDDAQQSKSANVFQCDLCSMRFFLEHRFTAHKRAHDGLIPYPCPREGCKKGFKRWYSLSDHLKQHEGTNRWFSCEEHDCKRRYKHKATLELHLRRYHKKGPELKSFVCEICGKVFKSSAILNDHCFTHKEKSELPFACPQPQCKYRFSNKAKLNVHMMRHAGIKKFVCPHCGMRKTTRNELNIHINYHTLERRFPCRFCSQVCNNAGNLKVHIRTVHELAKDYACRFCERSFAKPDTRKYHEMIHTGEKPHECSDCGKRFVQPTALRTHKKTHLRQHKQCDERAPLEKTHNEEASIAP